jgi:hypothetical protein
VCGGCLSRGGDEGYNGECEMARATAADGPATVGLLFVLVCVHAPNVCVHANAVCVHTPTRRRAHCGGACILRVCMLLYAPL